MRTVTLRNGTALPALGQGTWHIGDDAGRRSSEIEALRRGIELGMTLLDTAEMYGNGRSESIVGEAICDCREQVYLVDKVLPGNASARGTIEACERSLAALGTDRIDLYLLHWPGPHPVAETIAAFGELIASGLIGAWGVSNVDADELADYPQVPLVNQVLYNPSRRGPEFDLWPLQRRERIVAMAYSPIEQGRLGSDPTLGEIAREHDASVPQVLLAWAIRDGDVVAIPKASSVDHVQQNAAAADLELTADDLARVDAAFAAPARAVPLQML